MNRKDKEGIDVDRLDINEDGELQGLDEETLDTISGGLISPPGSEPNPMCPDQG